MNRWAVHLREPLLHHHRGLGRQGVVAAALRAHVQRRGGNGVSRAEHILPQHPTRRGALEEARLTAAPERVYQPAVPAGGWVPRIRVGVRRIDQRRGLVDRAVDRPRLQSDHERYGLAFGGGGLCYVGRKRRGIGERLELRVFTSRSVDEVDSGLQGAVRAVSTAIEKLSVSDCEAARCAVRRRQVVEAEVGLEMVSGENGARDRVVGHGERRSGRAVDRHHNLVLSDIEALEKHQERVLIAAHAVGRRGRRDGIGFGPVYGDRDRGEVYARHCVDPEQSLATAHVLRRGRNRGDRHVTGPLVCPAARAGHD